MDCLALIQAWERQGGKSTQLNDALKELFQTLLAQNISLCLQFVPSPLNQADAPSRVLSDKDCMLAPEPWKELENLFGPHTFDLMAFDSNAQIGCSSSPLPHFTPFPTPGYRGVNVFAQDEASQEDTYVFPPFILVLFSVFSTRPCSRSPLWFQNCLLYHIGGLLFKQGHLILSSWAIKLITISCYFHLRTTFFPHVLYLGICMLSEYQLASVCPFFRFSDLESGSRQLLALIVATLMMPFSTFARSAVSASFVQFPNILLSG